MASIFKTTRNTRILPTGSMHYVRSDAPLNLTDNEVKWLLMNDITTIVDLRSAEEVRSKPCFLAKTSGFKYFNLPVTGGGDTPKSLDELHKIYKNMLDKQMKKIIDTIMSAKSNVLYFCTAGKDRTGVVSAIILRRLGFDDETIISDYMESKDNLTDMLVDYVKEHPQVDIETIIPHCENMKNLLPFI